jgi:23S rRNA (cytosine1962-C5)-methyltransferase
LNFDSETFTLLQKIEKKMILADKWREYELLECGNGMKKERWGEIVLVRPDPQVLWQKKDDFSEFDAFYHRSASGGGKWEFKKKLPESWKINYRDLTFKIRPTDFKHTGLFPEQAVNWDWVSKLIKNSKREIKILNLFGYTGAATVSAAKAGAKVTHVDSAKGMVNWCKENAELSGLGKAPIRYIVDDVIKFVEREARRGNTYDGIIMDPPSYGRGKKGETWKIEKNLWPLLEKTAQILSDNPLFFLINSYTTGLSPTVLENMLKDIFDEGEFSSGEIGIPIKKDGKILPCGIYSRWEK